MPTLATIMTRHVISVNMDDEISLLETLRDSHGFKHFPVVDEEQKLVGIVSDRDICNQLSPFVHTVAETKRDEALLHRRAHQIMSRQPITANAEDDVDYAARLMLFNGISAIPVTDSDNRLVGIVTWVDLLCHYTRR